MSPHRDSTRPPAFLAAAVSAFLATGLAGCGSGRSDRYVNCIDRNGRVVDPAFCEDRSSAYWYYLASRRYGVGSSVPGDYTRTRINPSDQAARAAAGMPKTGNVGGTKISSGGFGKGSSSGHHGGGS
ncbi:hypothetical protein ACFFWC_09435 [Plantactinospora siamensis]|uniref:Lipoprotein n=1 Tax=Plantactinospora siamensis TaxID=555372 RepID=A0ABV6P6N8_9ACTN